MKKVNLIFAIALTAMFFFPSLWKGTEMGLFAQGVGINATGNAPDASAMLDVSSTNTGVLIPRVALTQTSSASPVTSPATSLLVYNTATINDVTPGYYYWNGSAWVRFATGSGSSGWLLTGNAGTVDGTNFLGTTDNIPLSFRVNNQKAGRIESNSTTGATHFGYQAGNANTADRTTFIGYNAGVANTSGSYNTALGYYSLYTNTTGEYNTAVGQQTLRNNNGSRNTAVGMEALIYNTSGSYNTSVGTFSTYSNNTGSYNTALGYYALYGVSANGNTGLGYQAGDGVSSGTYNTLIGYNADLSSGTLTNATAIGNGATATASNQVALGNASVTGLKIGTGSLATSASAANLYYDNATGLVYRSTAASGGGSAWLLTGNAGTVDGTNFLGTTDNIPLTIKVNNQKAGRIDNTKYNTFFGYQSGNVATGNYNTLLGNVSGTNQTTATENVFVGSGSGYYLQTGSSNTAIGYNALYCYGGSGGGPRPGGNGNVAIGKWAMFNPYSGDNNVGIGYSAYSLTHTGSENVFIGSYSDASSSTNPSYAMGLGARTKADANNATAIGYRAYANTANTIILGSINGVNGATVNTNVGIGIQAPSARLQIGGNGGFAIGDGTAISTTDGQRRSIQIATDNNYGGTHDNHSGYLIYSTMPGSWGTAQLDICTSNNWGTYATGTPALRVTQTAIYANGTSYTSDRRLKTDIRPMPYGLNQVMKMQPHIYTKHIADSIVNGNPVLGQGFQEVGFIAQDLYEIIPEVVHKPADESKEMWGIDYAKIVPILTQAIQEQYKIIETQNEKIELQNKKLQELEKKLQKFD